MSAIAHGWKPKGSVAKIPVKVAKEFHSADVGHKYDKGMDKAAKAKRIVKRTRKKYADGGETTADDMIDAAHRELSSQKDRPSIPDIGEPTIGNGGQFSRGYKSVNDVANTASHIAGHAMESGATLPFRYVKSMVDASKERPGSEEAHEAYRDVGSTTGELGLSMLGNKGSPMPDTAGVMVGPYGAHMLRAGNRPHPVYGQEAAEAAEKLRPEFRDAYKGWQADARDAQGRGVLEMRGKEGSNNPYDTDVWKRSGWHRGADEMPRKEISDLGARLVPVEGGYKLEHPAGDLHKVYDIPPIKVNKSLGKGNAMINHDTGQITISDPKEVSSALHEIQHAIQRKEGFSGGANFTIAPNAPEFKQEIFPKGGLSAEVPSWHKDLVAKQEEGGVDPEFIGAARARALFRTYERSAGETEARNVQERRAKGFRYQAHPADTEDITRGLQYESRSHAARPRKDIKIYDTKEMDPEDIIPGGAHRIYSNKYASGGGISGFNPERAEAYGLSKQGMLHSSVPGRTDKLNLDVPAGSYVIPADITSALGQGNSLAGSSVLTKMFTKGPYGMNLPKAKGPRTHPRAASLSKLRFADGGETPMAPIVAAGGEFVVHPESVAHLGGGDIDLGHNILDSFVKQVRDKNIQTLKGLKPPKGSK